MDFVAERAHQLFLGSHVPSPGVSARARAFPTDSVRVGSSLGLVLLACSVLLSQTWVPEDRAKVAFWHFSYLPLPARKENTAGMWEFCA